jgi:hypothetical protein
MHVIDEPMACSLDHAALGNRRNEWTRLLSGAEVEVTEVPGGIRIAVPGRDGPAGELRGLIGLEKKCCGWIKWSVQDADLLEVEATATDDGAIAPVREWFRPSPGRGRR